MLLNLVQTQINPVFNLVASAVNIREAISQPLNQSKVAYVVPVSERPEGNSRDEDIGAPIQKVGITFGVVIGIQSLNDPTGTKGLVALNGVRNELRTTLYGWKPANDYSPVLLGNSDVIGFAPNGLWWIDRFYTSIFKEGSRS